MAKTTESEKGLTISYETGEFSSVEILVDLDMRTGTPVEETGWLDGNSGGSYPGGGLAVADDNSAPDGRNASISHTAPVSGLYRIRIFATNDTRGEYSLIVTGATGSLPSFDVTQTSPSNGALLMSSPSQITVHFSDNVWLRSLDPADLTIGGTSALSFAVLDGNTVAFNLQALGEGTHNVAMA